jgi:CHAT domain-containing protein
VAAAARFFVGGHTKLLVDAQADEGLLKSLRWKDYRIIHFAVHGIFDDDNWTRSALLLQPDPASREDGYLQARDILPLSLASDLVVLSACQTARGSLQSGEGLVGLTSVFLFAGSRSVLASQWNINDASTAAFMGYFYDSLAKKRSSREALQQAKIKMIRSVYRHPFYWAAFILIGCPTDAYSITKSRDAEASSRPKLSLARTVQR